ncbi:ANR family transcriptional regulator [Morganella morganii]|uniref:ANR family transcriptional regulator n=2 Tax=Morganella morganii TaxID=582 RepID=UPI003D7F1219
MSNSRPESVSHLISDVPIRIYLLWIQLKEKVLLKIIADYQTMAERAAKAERTENFSQASVLWHEARLLARSSANREWCEVRSLLCSNFLNRRTDCR